MYGATRAPLNVSDRPLRRTSSLHNLHSLANNIGESQRYLMNGDDIERPGLDLSNRSSTRRNNSIHSSNNLAEHVESQVGAALNLSDH